MTKTNKKTNKKNKIKISKKTKKINVYGQHTYYMRNNSNDNKKLISELTNILHENQWLKVSSEKYKNTITKIINPSGDFKPQGSYYSKGGWLFNEMCCNLDDEIILIEVDYNNIYRIKGKTPYTQTNSNTIYKKNMNDFINKYGSKMNKYSCKTKFINNNSLNSINSKTNSKTNLKKIKSIPCYNFREKKKCISNKKCHWKKFFRTFKYPYKTHSGLAIYPLPSKKWLKTKFNERLIFNSYDVETLVLWNHESVIKHYNLGTIREIIGKIDKNINIKYDFTSYLIPNLISMINKINN